MPRKVIISGSARKNGDTQKVVDQMLSHTECDVIDLNDYEISYYDYDHKNKDDDYISLMSKVIANYDVLIFATPVYWYSMSAVMKTFLDRFTDLLTIEKDLGRKLRCKAMAVISCSNGNNLGDHFWLPFSESANYLGMTYLGNVHTDVTKNDTHSMIQFIKALESHKS